MLWFLIPGLVTLGSSLVQGVLQANETSKARKEARSIFDQTRADKLSEQNRNNELLTEKSKLADNDLSFNQKMFGEEQNLVNKQDSFLARQANRNQMKTATNKAIGVDEDSWLLRSKIINRN